MTQINHGIDQVIFISLNARFLQIVNSCRRPLTFSKRPIALVDIALVFLLYDPEKLKSMYQDGFTQRVCMYKLQAVIKYHLFAVVPTYTAKTGDSYKDMIRS